MSLRGDNKELVDSFGRTINPSRASSYSGEEIERGLGKSNNNSNYYDRSNEKPRNYKRRSNSRDRRRSDDRFDRSNKYDKSRPPSLNIPNNVAIQLSISRLLPTIPLIDPLMSFRTFITTLSDDYTPEIYQTLYDEYQHKYINDFSEKFFHVNKKEEWFRDRYDPTKQKENELLINTVIYKEAEYFRDELFKYTKDSINAMSLDPSNKSIYPEFTEIAGRFGRGHRDRSIYITSIPDKCTKPLLLKAINDALIEPAKNRYSTPPIDKPTVEATGIPLPDRLILTQPTWTLKNPQTFERSAWLIMPTVESTQLALQVLRNLIISIPNAEQLDGVSVTLFEFPLQVSLNVQRQGPVLPKYLSHAKRIKVDTERAIELASLLDEERDVPSDRRFSYLIESPEVTDNITKPTDKLDITIAYLRRVHYVTFYGGRRFKDEGHLLMRAPAILYRSNEYYDDEIGNDLTAQSNDKVEPENNEIEVIEADKATENDTSKIDSDNEENDARVNDDDEEDEDDDNDNPRKRRAIDLDESIDLNTSITSNKDDEKTDNNVITKPKPLFSNSSRVPLIDKRVDSIIYEAKSKRKQRLSKLEDTNYFISNEEKEINNIIKRQEEVFENNVISITKLEAEGKARCCYESCKKLFKNIDFLMKHIRIKHNNFAIDAIIKESESLMKNKYEKEDILKRPLPAIEVEVNHGIELKSINNILDKLSNKNYRNNDYKDRMIGNKRSYDNRRNTLPNYTKSYQKYDDYRHDDHIVPSIDVIQSKTLDPPVVQVQPPPVILRKYVDVDAPTANVMDIDYGVTIAPITKKRKIIVSKKVSN